METHQSATTAGDRIDHYTLDRLVATSTTACIYQGTDLRTGSPVAIKLPHLEVEGDPLFYRRIAREQQVGEQLNHPSIVRFFTDARRSRNYVVMEWAEGRPLRGVLAENQGPLAPARAVQITLQLCDALAYLQTQGVVHRDLKPENILVDAADRVKLIDFGLASLAGARRLTFGKLSQVIGTPDYISPEQVSGKRADTRSDVYALGVILYEMLTGTTPFPGDNPFAVMNLRLIEPPVSPREANPEISLSLQEILYRALERDANDRYASARKFRWDLEHQDQVEPLERAELRKESPIATLLRYARLT